MVISVIQFIIEIPGANSLKDKRRIVKSIKDRLIQRYKLSVAEVDNQDSIRTAHIAAVIVSNSKQHGESILHKALQFVEDNIPGYLVDTKIFSEQY